MTPPIDALIYVGVSDAVEVVDAGIVAVCDVPVKVGDGPGEIPSDVALRLLEQRDSWRKAPAEKAPPKL